jgi:hypothetical protein
LFILLENFSMVKNDYFYYFSCLSTSILTIIRIEIIIFRKVFFRKEASITHQLHGDIP